MISEQLKNKFLQAKSEKEFRLVCEQNGNPMIKDVGTEVCEHFIKLTKIENDIKNAYEAGYPRQSRRVKSI